MDISERRNQLIGGGVFIKVIHSALNALSSSEANTIFSRQNQQHSRIKHNISFAPLSGTPQRVSDACGSFPAPLTAQNRENGPDDFGAAAWLCTDMPGRYFSG